MFKKSLLIFILMTAQAFAQTAKQPAPAPSAQPEQRGSDKLDIKKLENKYWAAKDEDFGVVQNRRYVKAERFYLTARAGIPVNDAFSEGTIMGADVGYFFNERWGVEVSYNNANLTENDSTEQFHTQNGAMPDHNILKSSYFASAIWVPFYAKMSALDKAIIYFDMGVSVGLGNVNYEIARSTGNEAKSSIGYKLGVFQQIFFSEHFALRADLINTWANESQKPYTVSSPRVLGDKMVNDTSLMFGLTYWH
ncbi:outer membrane beta-barrel domain-containing protein [Bdellovibrio sp. ZAP7]|uniref:outer membrane beta-barrel domain-containing protein n=1 Tax=Bdellovibrio sp. ZAP7 TaxID=2231053 RepID=UPI0011580A0B|nr:outer membrane beta-barrel domain-containing protein [Bdellovibrio sp. ZAP7]QDK45080.1 outer membrane beta-barrel domain-containing protein [Bdellovibrio sp. ZAP7]